MRKLPSLGIPDHFGLMLPLKGSFSSPAMRVLLRELRMGSWREILRRKKQVYKL
jgi:hypothetical protein